MQNKILWGLVAGVFFSLSSFAKNASKPKPPPGEELELRQKKAYEACVAEKQKGSGSKKEKEEAFAKCIMNKMKEQSSSCQRFTPIDDSE